MIFPESKIAPLRSKRKTVPPAGTRLEAPLTKQEPVMNSHLLLLAELLISRLGMHAIGRRLGRFVAVPSAAGSAA
jgi:hypothetical protein